MKILGLHLKSFRQHHDTEVEFHDGLTGIVGANGAGKTSLVEGIAFALYGSRAVRGKLDDVRTRGARRGEPTLASLRFEHDGIAYRVERTLGDAKLFSAGSEEPLVTGTTEVTARVTVLLGMSYEEFSATYYTEQKGLEFLSGKRGATERERFIVRMMGYDRLELAQERLRADRREIKAQVQGFEASLGDRDELVRRVEEEERTAREVEQRYREAGNSLTETEQRLATARQALEEREQAKQAFEQQRSARTDLASRQREKLERRTAVEREIARLVQQREELGELPAIEALEAERVQVQRTVSQAQQQWIERRSALEGELRSVELLLERTRKAVQQSEELTGDACPTCGQELGSGFVKVRQAREREVADLEVALTTARTAAEREREEPEALVNGRSRLGRIEEQLERARHAAQLQSREQELRDELHQLDQQLGQLSADLERIEQEARSIRFNEEEYRQARVTFESVARLVELARLQRVRLEGERNTKQALVARSREALSSFDERAAQLEDARSRLLLIERGDLILTEFRKHLNSSIRPRLAELASEFLADLTDGRYVAVEIGEDFAPTVLEDERPKPVISGGEQDILNLCVRLALSHMLAERAGQPFNLLLLDEVFGSLDEQRRANVLTLLERLNARFEQILLITHFDEIKEGVQHLVQLEFDEAEQRLSLTRTADLTEINI